MPPAMPATNPAARSRLKSRSSENDRIRFFLRTEKNRGRREVLLFFFIVLSFLDSCTHGIRSSVYGISFYHIGAPAKSGRSVKAGKKEPEGPL